MDQFDEGLLYVRVVDGKPADLIVPTFFVGLGKTQFPVNTLASMRGDVTELVDFSGHFTKTEGYPGIYKHEVRRATDDDLSQLLTNCPACVKARLPAWHNNLYTNRRYLYVYPEEKQRISDAIANLP